MWYLELECLVKERLMDYAKDPMEHVYNGFVLAEL